MRGEARTIEVHFVHGRRSLSRHRNRYLRTQRQLYIYSKPLWKMHAKPDLESAEDENMLSTRMEKIDRPMNPSSSLK